MIAAACGDNERSSAKAITSFEFLASNNPQLSTDVVAAISGDHISATLPYGTDLSALVATFTTTGSQIYVDTYDQQSGVSKNNFSQSIEYVVSAADHSSKTYTVTATTAVSGAKALTSFSFLAANNPGLTGDVIATISGNAIGAILPYGTDITSLKPTFTTTGMSVMIGNKQQISGGTADNFMKAFTVVVTAADKTSQSYSLTVLVAASSAKQMMVFELSSALNSDAGVSSNEMATISGANIMISVPYGTDVTALVPTFMSNGAKVTINGVEQVSGMTAVDFTHPVTYVVTPADASTQMFTVYVTVAKNPAKAITSFEFTSAANEMSSDAVATISGFQIGVTVPFGTDTSALVATFQTTGASVSVGGVAQQSGVTANDFSSGVTYLVTASDGTTQSYAVTVTISKSSADSISMFEFTSALNDLPSDAVADIEGTTIAVTVPYGTDPTALIATFATSGNTVAVGSAAQTSGMTPNDFSSEVDYTVTAQDGSTKDYFVDVTVAKNPAKALTSFEFASQYNSDQGVSSDAVGTIGSNFDIEVTVPYGTDTTGLVASFTTTGQEVDVGSAAQTSGASIVDFSQGTVDYVVDAADGTTQTYTVNVTVALNPAKDITSFEFKSSLNSGAGVATDAVAVIAGTTITVCFPPGVTPGSLIAAFTTDGASVAIDGVAQQSDVTANDFSAPVSYTVTAADGSQQTYTVQAGDSCYATAVLAPGSADFWWDHTNPTARLVFLYAPAGTEIDTDAEYKAYCESHGFEQNQNHQNASVYSEADMVSSTDFYCADDCCLLGTNNNNAERWITQFQNFGLPLSQGLQVFDRGCGDIGGSFAEGVNTADTLTLSSENGWSYTSNGSTIYATKSTTFATDGVVVCQAPGLE